MRKTTLAHKLDELIGVHKPDGQAGFELLVDEIEAYEEEQISVKSLMLERDRVVLSLEEARQTTRSFHDQILALQSQRLAARERLEGIMRKLQSSKKYQRSHFLEDLRMAISDMYGDELVRNESLDKEEL